MGVILVILVITTIMSIITFQVISMLYEVIYRTIFNIFGFNAIDKTDAFFKGIIGYILIFVINIFISKLLVMFIGNGMTAGVSNLAASVIIGALNRPIINRAKNKIGL